MKNNPAAPILTSVLKQSEQLVRPTNFHQGLHFPSAFELPDNIICFFYAYPSDVLQHNRFCIVIPFDTMLYILDDIPHVIQPGMVVMQWPYAAHGVSALHGECRRLQISFDPCSQNIFFPDQGISSLSTTGLRIIRRILRSFIKGDVVECSYGIYSLCKKMKVKNGRKREEPSPELKSKVEAITEFRRERRENVKSIALKLKMSESNLRLRFRKENGLPLGKFLQIRKLEGAKYRLQYTEQSIVEISMLCGFDSVVSFDRFFKAQTGLPPLQWRKIHQNTRKIK